MGTPLTDRINALTTYANGVTGKTDTNLSDAVRSLAEGYSGDTQPLKIAASIDHLFYGVDFDCDTLTLDFGGNVITRSAEYFMANVIGVKKVIIKNVTLNGSCRFAFNGGSYETLEFVNCEIKPTNAARLFSSNTLKQVVGEIDFSDNTGGHDALYFSRALEEIRFKKDSISYDFTVTGASHLSDESLVSIANALNGSVTKSLTSTKAYTPRVNVITGNNVDGSFVIDDQGAMTLSDFVTNIKGWSVT